MKYKFYVTKSDIHKAYAAIELSWARTFIYTNDGTLMIDLQDDCERNAPKELRDWIAELKEIDPSGRR